jgi:hypothetical protein
MRTPLVLACLCFLACPKETPKEPTTTNASDTKPKDSVPAAWPPAGYQMAKPMGNPVRSTPGWVELPSLATHRMMEAVAQQKPLLNGTFDDEGMFYTTGEVDGGVIVKECPSEKEMYLNITKMKMSPTLPAMAPDNILLLLCEGKNPIEGKLGLIVPK